MPSVECLLEDGQVVVSDAKSVVTSMDDVDIDEDLSESEDENEELSWRLPPSRSLSDWTVRVHVKGTVQSTTYHVHKSVLAVGPRRSNFFANAFKTSQRRSPPRPKNANSPRGVEQYDYMSVSTFHQSKSTPTVCSQSSDEDESTTELELESLASHAFPVVLDFLYSSENKLAINTRNAVSVAYLAEKLEMKLLKKLTDEFWMPDISMENITLYYRHARVFKFAEVLSFCENFCAQHVFEARENVVVNILTAVDPNFFLRVVTHESVIGTGKDKKSPVVQTNVSLRLSLLIAVYCNIHRNELDAVTFRRLTSDTHLPVVEVKAAKALLELEDDICGPKDRGLTPLKERCISVLSANWDEACLKEIDVNTVSLPRLYGGPLEKFVSMALTNAKERMVILSKEVQSLQAENDKLKASMEDHPAALDRITELQNECDKLRREKEKLERHLTDARVKLDKLRLQTRQTSRPVSPNLSCSKE